MLKNTLNRYKYYVLSLIFIGFAISFVQTTTNVTKNKKRLDELKDEVLLLQQEEVTLKQDIEYQKTNEYIEAEARNKLNLIKPTETVYVIDPEFTEYLQKNKDNLYVSEGESEDTMVADSYVSEWLKLIF